MTKKLMMVVAALAVAFGAWADTWTDPATGYTWTYRINGGTAEIYRDGDVAISPLPTGAVSIPSTLGGKPVTIIGDSTFKDCSGLTSVAIPDGVTSIGEAAFSNCWNLTYVKIPDSIARIGRNAFLDCNDSLYDTTTIECVKLVDGWAVDIDGSSFWGEMDLTGVRGIGDWAFANTIYPGGVSSMGGLESVKIPETVKNIGDGTFYHCMNLISVEIPNSVTNIGDHAFYQCYHLRVTVPSTIIPSSVKSIGDWAFAGNWNINNCHLRIPNGVRSIGKHAFTDWKYLERVTIPDSVTRIGSGAFANFYPCGLSVSEYINYVSVVLGDKTYHFSCVDGWLADTDLHAHQYALREPASGTLVLPDIRGVEDEFFYVGGLSIGCRGITHVTIPKRMNSIGEETFWNCENLETVEFENRDSNTQKVSIAQRAFALCSKLKDIDLGVVCEIGNNAFYGCSGLTDVTIPSCVTSIGEGAFDGCSGLTNVIVGVGTANLHSAFVTCSNLTSVTIPQNISSSLLLGSDAMFPSLASHPTGYRLIKNVTFSDGVTDIRSDFFNSCTNLTKVIIPPSITNIATNAFVTCSNLVDVTMPWMPGMKLSQLFPDSYRKIKKLTLTGSIDHIPAGAFKGCASLERVDIPKAVKRVGASAFEGCASLTGLKLPDGVGEVGASAFKGCKALKTPVELPNSVTNLGASAFADCTGLEHVDWHWWPWRLKEIPSSLFKGCTNLERVDGISSSIGRIGASAFEDCESLSSILLPSSVTNMGAKVFQGCSGLTSAQLPSNLKSIPDYTFNGCGWLMSVTMPSSPTSIGKAAFFGCLHKTSIDIPKTVTKIGEQAFGNCWVLNSLDIPEGVSVLPAWMCGGCGALSRISIPSGVAKVSDNAFAGCTNLASVALPGSVTDIGTNAFARCVNLKTILLDDRTNAVSVVSNSIPVSTTVKVLARNGYSFAGWADETDTLLSDPFHMGENVTAIPVWLATGGGSEPLPEPTPEPGTAPGPGTTPDPEPSSGQEIVIADDATEIDAYEFYGNETHGAIVIPASVKNIGRWAFAACKGISEVEIPASVTNIGAYAFSNNRALTNIVMHTGLSTIQSAAFLNTGLHDAVIPDSVVSVGNCVFEYCYSLTNAIVGESVSEMGQWVFDRCTNLAAVVFRGDAPALEPDADIYRFTKVSLVTYVPRGSTGWDVPILGVWQGRRIAYDGEAPLPLWIVVLDTQGGDADETTLHAVDGTTVGTLPTPTRTGYTFAGWYTAATGGTQVTAATKVTAAVTFYAHWTPNGGGAPTPTPEPVVPCYEAIEAGDVGAGYAAPKAVTLMGAVYDDCDVVGVVELKLGKVSKGKSKISGSFTGLDGKKVSIKAVTVTGIDGSAPVSVSLAVKGHGTMDVTIGGSRFAGSLGGKYHVQSAAVGGAWAGGTAKATVDSEIGDLARFPGTLLTDFLPDEERASVKNGKWTFAKAASVKWAKPKKGAALPELYDEASGKGLIIDTSKGKTNLSGLKLTYTPKKGTFKGSFKVYALEGSGKKTKLKTYTVNVNGFVVDGVGYGTATCNKPAVSWTVMVE